MNLNLKNKRYLILLSIPVIGVIIVLEIIFLTQSLSEPNVVAEKPTASRKNELPEESESLPKKQALAEEILYTEDTQDYEERVSRETSMTSAPPTSSPEDPENRQPSQSGPGAPGMGDEVQPSNYDSPEEKEPNSQEVIYTQPPPEVLRAREEEAQMTDEERQERKRIERIEAAKRIYGGLTQRIEAMRKNIQLAEEQGSGIAIELEEARKLLDRTIEFKKQFEDKMKELQIDIPAPEDFPMPPGSETGGNPLTTPASENAPNETPKSDAP